MSLLVYPMGTLRIPPTIVEQFDKLRRRCLWIKKTGDGFKSNALVAWNAVCRPKENGGLGVLNLKLQNDAMLLKMLHKFYNRKDISWVALIWNTHYGEAIPHAQYHCGSFWWRELTKLMPVFRGITRVNVNNCLSTLFWKDNWNNAVYAEKFPRAFSFARTEDDSVQNFLGTSSLQEAFSLLLSEQAHDELRMMQQEI